MSQRLRDVFAKGKAEGRALFIGYVTAGYPTRADTVPILLGMEAGGCDVIEVGVPFTDPLADGATVQHANHVAIEQGVTLSDCFALIREARAQGLKVPVVFMGYYNPILAMGDKRAASEASAAGADGFIVVDLPPEEASPFVEACRANGMSLVPLLAPTTSEDRVDKLVAVADSFIYCVSVTGTTGGGNVVPEQVPAMLEMVRRHTDLPLAVGFGITRREHVQAVGKVADAVVIGSAIISAIDAADGKTRAQSVREFVENVTGH
ncbi:MAG TPA: tryptophan synthase subunit alpha [Tepidiformaceae bacterium]|nr:tryptophan synthase subunit alpha [Tepidiformaceae bacterium]